MAAVLPGQLPSPTRRQHLFVQGVSTSIPLSTTQIVSTSTPMVPLGSNTIEILEAYAVLSPQDASGQLQVVALSIHVQYFDPTATLLDQPPLPTQNPEANAATQFHPLPALTNAPYRAAAYMPPGRPKIATASEFGLSGSGLVTQVALIAYATILNKDAAAAHSIAVAIGGIIEFS